MEEYSERVWDVYYSKAGNADEQAVTAVILRFGLSGIAYEADRGIAHDELITYDAEGKRATTAGVKRLLAALEGVVSKERPVRAAEMFDTVLYNAAAWGKPR